MKTIARTDVQKSQAWVALLALLLGLSASALQAENRSINGSGNNLLNPAWGAAGSLLQRMAPPAYDDGISAPRSGPNPRAVSNLLMAQGAPQPNAHAMTGWVFQWGQFIDHDLDLTGSASPPEPFNIAVPTGDSHFDPTSTGTQVIRLNRSHYDPTTGTSNPRQQVNEITSYLDASNVYGSDALRATALRSLSGGRLQTSAGNLLPLNTVGLDNATGGPADPTQFYLAGDVRANEQVGLAAVHTLFLREHNRLADQIASSHPDWDDEQIYQRSRKLVGAQIQAITYQEFLPTLLGSAAPGIHSTYNATLDATVLNEFSTALFRVGHTMLPSQLERIQSDGTPAPGGPLALRDAFFRPQSFADPIELEYHLHGLAAAPQQEIDLHVIDDVRNFLFGMPGAGGFDLASLNIQRGRDHGLPDYNTLRVAFGLSPKLSFEEISSDPLVQAGLESLYGNVAAIDPWVGALSEDPLADSQVGELITAGIVEQFTRTRDGDRFWFLRDAELADDLDWLLTTRLSDVLQRNTGMSPLQANVFFMPVPEPSTIWLAAGLICQASCYRRTFPR